MTGYYLTNWSLLYLDYATRIMFKSSKVLPVMFFGSIVQNNKHYSLAEYTSGGLLVVGVALFTLGESHTADQIADASDFSVWHVVVFWPDQVSARHCNAKPLLYLDLKLMSQNATRRVHLQLSPVSHVPAFPLCQLS